MAVPYLLHSPHDCHKHILPLPSYASHLSLTHPWCRPGPAKLLMGGAASIDCCLRQLSAQILWRRCALRCLCDSAGPVQKCWVSPSLGYHCSPSVLVTPMRRWILFLEQQKFVWYCKGFMRAMGTCDSVGQFPASQAVFRFDRSTSRSHRGSLLLPALPQNALL